MTLLCLLSPRMKAARTREATTRTTSAGTRLHPSRHVFAGEALISNFEFCLNFQLFSNVHCYCGNCFPTVAIIKVHFIFKRSASEPQVEGGWFHTNWTIDIIQTKGTEISMRPRHLGLETMTTLRVFTANKNSKTVFTIFFHLYSININQSTYISFQQYIFIKFSLTSCDFATSFKSFFKKKKTTTEERKKVHCSCVLLRSHTQRWSLQYSATTRCIACITTRRLIYVGKLGL